MLEEKSRVTKGTRSKVSFERDSTNVNPLAAFYTFRSRQCTDSEELSAFLDTLQLFKPGNLFPVESNLLVRLEHVLVLRCCFKTHLVGEATSLKIKSIYSISAILFMHRQVRLSCAEDESVSLSELLSDCLFGASVLLEVIDSSVHLILEEVPRFRAKEAWHRNDVVRKCAVAENLESYRGHQAYRALL